VAANITIINPANNAQIPNGGQVNANGTYGPAGVGVPTMVQLSICFCDVTCNEHQINLQANLNQAAGTWTCSFHLPLPDWRYIFCAMAVCMADGTRDRKDRYVFQGNPP
jgi:hypothetical protein